MRTLLASRIMRTTIDIDDPILQDLKRLQKKQGKSLGRLVSDLLAVALVQLKEDSPKYDTFTWITQNMSGKIDLADKDALLDAMDDPVERKLSTSRSNAEFKKKPVSGRKKR
jgi:hypothetical protein